MRVFKTTNASRRYYAGGFAFDFEPVGNFGGAWLGVLAVADEAAANALAAAKIPQVSEITQEEHDDLKKKPPTLSSFKVSQQPSPVPPPQLPIVPPAAKKESRASSETSSEPAPQPVVGLTVGDVTPPIDLDLGEVATPKKKKK